MKKSLLLFFVLVVLFSSGKSRAGGPLIVNNGVPAIWPSNNQNIVYTLDQGRLGNLSSFQAANLFISAFDKWSRVSTSNLRFTRNSSSLPEDVTVDNFERILDSLPSGANPVIFDDDGEIIDAMLGDNAKRQILGFATVYSSGNQIVRAETVFNGYFIRTQNQTEDEIISTLLHEIGHICGLDHSQFSREIAYNTVSSDNQSIAIMFPTSTYGDDARTELTFDDETSVSNLYPTTYFINSTGSIAGAVKRSGAGLPGVNIIARNILDPVNLVSSTVTGTFEQNAGSYALKGLPPGEYEIMAEAIDESYTGTSSVGQYSESLSDRSFRRQVKPEYYNENDLTLEGRSTASFVTVSNLRTVSGIDINVPSQVLPSDEKTVRLLAIDSQAPGAASASSTAIRYLLEPEGDEGTLELKVSFSTSTNYQIRIERDTSNTPYTVSRTASEAIIRIGSNGDIPLQSTRYFIDIANRSSFERSFTVSVEKIAAIPTPTPTDTPSPTSTPSPTATQTPTAVPEQTPTHTMTPAPVNTPAFTPTPKPERTPTPIPPAGDVNLDGKADTFDLFTFTQDWQKSASNTSFRSNLARTRSLIIDKDDLLALIEALQEEKNPSP